MRGKREIVCMHDVVREMALWIASVLGKQKEAFIVRAGIGLDKMPKVENWNVVRRMSLMKNKIRHLAGGPECLELTTFLMQYNFLGNISSEFFSSMPKLVVLDLSSNEGLYELPDKISELVSLQYLDLSNTGIRHLSMGLQKLNKLVHLDLDFTRCLSSIAGISSLHSLRVLKLTESGFTWDLGIVEELESLEHLEILTTSFIRNPPCLEKFLSSQKLTSCTQSLRIWCMESSGISLPVTMDKLRDLNTHACNFTEIKMGRICIKSKMVSPIPNPRNPCFSSLSKVDIIACLCLRELMFAVNLKDLLVSNAYQLKDIINKEKAGESEESGIVPFPNLVYLTLCALPRLKNIYWNPLPLQCLKDIYVSECPNLKKLPLNSQSGVHGEKGLVIKYKEKKWIEAVEWQDEASKTRFLSSCDQVAL